MAGRLSSTTSSGRSSGRGRAANPYDLTTVEGLSAYAKASGLGEEASKITDTTPKLSFLQRLSTGLSSLNPANAVATGMDKGLGAGLIQYPKDVVKGIGSAITGTDYQPDRKMFKDVAEDLGIENGIAKWGIGFAGDVLLDPSTYFGGAIAKGVLKGAGVGTELALKTVGKVAPESETLFRAAGTNLQDAFGSAFSAGYKATEGAKEGVITFLGSKSRKLIQSASDQMANLGVKGLTESQRLEVGIKTVMGRQGEYLLGEQLGSRAQATSMVAKAQATGDFSKIAAIDTDLAKKVNVTFDTPQQTEYFAKQQARAKEFAQLGGVEDPYTIYMPSLKKGAEVTPKLIQEMNRNGVTIGSKSYLKEFKNILTHEEIELNPAIAHGTREAQIIADTENATFLKNFVDKYGKSVDSFATEAEAKQAGLSVLREKGGLGKVVGYVGQWDAKLFNDLIRPEFQTINMLAKATGFDAVTGLFKRMVTGPFLPFHVRNFFSGIIQNYEVLGWRALLPQNMNAGRKFAYYMGKGGVIPNAEKDLVLAGKTMKFGDVFKPLFERFSGDTFYHTDFLDEVSAGRSVLKSSEKILSKSALRSSLGFEKGNVIPLIGADGVIFKTARVAGQFIEHQQKATAYITALTKGHTIEESLKLAERAGFDYRNLTAFESQILKRIIPFYSFTRKNIELQLRTLGENPERINQVLSFFQNIGDRPTAEEKKNLPDYIASSIGIKLADLPDGIKQYISSFGTPIESFANLINGNPILQTISTMNPLLKVPVELGIGKDSFRQKDLKDVYDASEYKGMPQVVKDMLDIKVVKKDILQKQGDGSLKKIGLRDVYVADPVKLLIARSLFTSRGVTYLDQLFGGDLKGFVKALKTTTGIKPQLVDVELQQSIKESQKKRDLEDLLKRNAKTATFSKTYIPK